MNELEQTEFSIELAKSKIAVKEAFDRLIQNKDYKLLIEEEYFLQEASRLVLMKADPALQDDAQQNQLLGRMAGIGYLRQYMGDINAQGIQAMNDLNDYQQTYEELLQEDIDKG